MNGCFTFTRSASVSTNRVAPGPLVNQWGCRREGVWSEGRGQRQGEEHGGGGGAGGDGGQADEVAELEAMEGRLMR